MFFFGDQANDGEKEVRSKCKYQKDCVEYPKKNSHENPLGWPMLSSLVPSSVSVPFLASKMFKSGSRKQDAGSRMALLILSRGGSHSGCDHCRCLFKIQPMQVKTPTMERYLSKAEIGARQYFRIIKFERTKFEHVIKTISTTIV